MRGYLTHLECRNCSVTCPANLLRTVCPVGRKVLYAGYDRAAAAVAMTPAALDGHPT
jgi:hypothetical protein